MQPPVDEDEDEMLRMAIVMSSEQEEDPRVQENTMNQVSFDILDIGFKSNVFQRSRSRKLKCLIQ